MASIHRKKVKSYNIPGHAHELTFSCFKRQPFLSRDRTCRWIVDAMEAARKQHHFALWAYVVMPEHVHVLCWPRLSEYKMSLIKGALKNPVARKAIKHLREHSPGSLKLLEDIQPNGKIHHRFWQRGGGYDRNAFEPVTILAMIDYMHNNPVRRGLVANPTDWIWSSARFYAGEIDVPIRMDPLPCLDG